MNSNNYPPPGSPWRVRFGYFLVRLKWRLIAYLERPQKPHASHSSHSSHHSHSVLLAVLAVLVVLSFSLYIHSLRLASRDIRFRDEHIARLLSRNAALEADAQRPTTITLQVFPAPDLSAEADWRRRIMPGRYAVQPIQPPERID